MDELTLPVPVLVDVVPVEQADALILAARQDLADLHHAVETAQLRAEATERRAQAAGADRVVLGRAAEQVQRYIEEHREIADRELKALLEQAADQARDRVERARHEANRHAADARRIAALSSGREPLDEAIRAVDELGPGEPIRIDPVTPPDEGPAVDSASIADRWATLPLVPPMPAPAPASAATTAAPPMVQPPAGPPPTAAPEPVASEPVAVVDPPRSRLAEDWSWLPEGGDEPDEPVAPFAPIEPEPAPEPWAPAADARPDLPPPPIAVAAPAPTREGSVAVDDPATVVTPAVTIAAPTAVAGSWDVASGAVPSDVPVATEPAPVAPVGTPPAGPARLGSVPVFALLQVAGLIVVLVVLLAFVG